MKNFYIVLICLLFYWSDIVTADTNKLNTVTIPTTVTVNKTNYPAKLTFTCTKDENTNVRGALSLNISMPATIADYLPMSDIEGPDAKLSVKAKINANSQTQKKSFQALTKTNTWFDEKNNVVFGVSESHQDHGKLYRLANYLANNTSALRITLENPQKNQPSLLIKTSVSSTTMQQLMKTCY